MAHYALVNNTTHIVTNIILWDGGPEYTPPDGVNAVVCDGTPAYIGGTYINNVFSAMPPVLPPAPTPQSQAAAALAAGVALTSTGTPGLNGTYSCTAQSVSNVANVTTYILRNNKFPGGVSQMPWMDVNSVPHVFPDVATFDNFATKFADFVAACQIYSDSNGQIGSIPSNAITIP